MLLVLPCGLMWDKDNDDSFTILFGFAGLDSFGFRINYSTIYCNNSGRCDFGAMLIMPSYFLYSFVIFLCKVASLPSGSASFCSSSPSISIEQFVLSLKTGFKFYRNSLAAFSITVVVLRIVSFTLIFLLVKFITNKSLCLLQMIPFYSRVFSISAKFGISSS